MNTKKNKSKKRQNKVPNPIPPQKIDVVQITDETVDLKTNIKPESAANDDRVAEICEQISSPAPSLQDIHGETPKKPKRNRGKKNNQDKEHGVNDENNDKLVPEEAVVEIEKEQTTAKEAIETTDSTEVAPTACKSKKKGKKNAEELVGIKSKEVVRVTHKEENKTFSENTSVDIEQEASAKAKEVVEDSKASKKKNKRKKHRNDSEKSDKCEEITCTSAFQKLLEDDVKNIYDKSEDTTSTQVEDSTTSEATVKEISEKVTFTESGNVIPFHQTDTNIFSETITQEQVQEELQCEGIKNKKKNKKEKKQASKKEQTTEILSKSPIEQSVVAEEKSSDEHFIVQTNEENKPEEQEIFLDSVLIKEKSPKPKAKIARPVEKKSNTKTKIDAIDSTDITEATTDKTTEKLTILMPNIERAKDDGKTTEIKGDDEFSFQEPRAINEKIGVDLKADLKIPLRPETSKKRSKSPKQPKESGSTKPKEENVKLEPDIRLEDSNAKATSTGEPKTETSLKLTLLEEIGLSGLTPETSEGSTCDFVPDFIEYPRSISEQSIDTNNNMVIKELLPTPELKSTDEPVFQDTTKLLTVSLVDDSKSPESDLLMKKPKDGEKFDLKSKMMEVNQDMEGLKLSIEKSLAELKALEKSEEPVEKPIEKFQKLEKELVDVEEMVKNEPQLSNIPKEETIQTDQKDIAPPIPARKDYKGKGKSKKKFKQEVVQSTLPSTTVSTTDKKESESSKCQESKDKSDEKRKDGSQEQEKKHSDTKLDKEDNSQNFQDFNSNDTLQQEYEPIENFEDAMSSSVDDVNQTFEIIASEASIIVSAIQNNPEINIIAPSEDQEKEDKNEEQAVDNSVPQPKNLLGRPDIPVSSNKTDYKKEKNKTPNATLAKVKIKDCVEIEKDDTKKHSKESQTLNKPKSKSNDKAVKETVSCITNGDEEYVYKYSFRKVFLQSCCHVCKKELKQIRVPCQFCSLIFYCSHKHKDEDWAKHQALCFTVSTITHLRNQKHIYADAKGVTGQDYRLLRMQIILSCEKILKRMMLPWEQEALLYPRMCADVNCRQWHQSKLKDCEGCGQISYCSKNPDHLPKSHQRWCKSYALYQKLVCHQQIKGRLEPKLPTRVMKIEYKIPEKINEVLASMFEEKIDMNDMQYAALTQLATAPVTAVYCHQLYTSQSQCISNGVSKSTTFILHVVGAELQFEADVLNKWEIFFLHLRPDIKELRVVLISPDLNPSNLPLDLLGKVKLCANCTQNKRRVVFDFQDKKNYFDYWASDDFLTPDLVCAFNASIQRASTYNGRDPWPSAINSVLKMKVPFAITSYTLAELKRDLERIKECATVKCKVIAEPKPNAFASVRPDRNFISDDEMPLLFKNFCFMIVCGDF